MLQNSDFLTFLFGELLPFMHFPYLALIIVLQMSNHSLHIFILCLRDLLQSFRAFLRFTWLCFLLEWFPSAICQILSQNRRLALGIESLICSQLMIRVVSKSYGYWRNNNECMLERTERQNGRSVSKVVMQNALLLVPDSWVLSGIVKKRHDEGASYLICQKIKDR